MNFIDFKNAVAKQFDLLSKQPELFRTTATKDELWDTYLSSFPEGTNPIYREITITNVTRKYSHMCKR